MPTVPSADNSKIDVSIIIPHFETCQLVRLCLNAIRLFTRDVNYEVIVVDNGSKDEDSLEYLRSVDWIQLIERTENIGHLGKGHKEAIDIGVAASSGEYWLAFHTDTIPIRDDWLIWLVTELEANPKRAAVGTYKLELKSRWRLYLKQLEKLIFWKKKRVRNNVPNYIRSHCALYHKGVLKALDLKYDDPQGDVAGRSVHLGLENSGYEACLLRVDEMIQRVVHLNHGTMVVHPKLGARATTIRKGQKRIQEFMNRPEIQKLMQE